MTTTPGTSPSSKSATLWVRWVVRAVLLGALLVKIEHLALVPHRATLNTIVVVILLVTFLGTFGKELRRPGAWVQAVGLLTLPVVLLVIEIGVADVIMRKGRQGWWLSEGSAVSYLRSINTAEANYSSTYDVGFSPILAALGPPPAGAQPSASASGLFDSVLASELRRGYSFTYTPGPPDKTGHIKTYTLVARPMQYGKLEKMSFFTDESGVIRKTEEDRPATAKDPPIGA